MKSFGKIAALKELILSDIRSGVLSPGMRIPSRASFMNRCGCARASIDRAVEELVADGFLYSRQGSGTFVAEPQAREEEISRLAIIGSFKSSRGVWRASNLTPVDPLQQRFKCKLYDIHRVGVNLNRIARGGTGVVWMYPRYQELMAMDFLDKFHIPQLLIFRIFDNYDYITTDAYASIAHGLEWLTGEAGKTMGFITSLSDTRFPYVAERQLCFYELAIRQGITVPPEWLCCDYLRDAEPVLEMMRSVVRRLFGGARRCRAIYLDTINWYKPFLAAASEFGFRPKRDFHLLVFDSPAPNATPPAGVAWMRQNFEGINDKIIEWVEHNGRKPMRLKIDTILETGK